MYPQPNQLPQQGSKPYKIFGHGRAGIDISQVTQGRNVQPFTSNKKIQQGFQKPIPSPFDGYAPINSEANLAYSQVSDLNGELTRKIVREQLSKLGGADITKIRNDVDVMKTEIRSLKENVLKSSNASTKNSEELQAFKDEVLKQFDRLLQEYHQTTASNLREVIKKFDENIKKDCTAKFLPIHFVNDVEKQFVQLEDRIVLLQSKADGNKRRGMEEPIVVAEALDLRLKKVERQNQSYKRTLTDLQNVVNQLTEQTNNLRTKQTQDGQMWKQKLEDHKRSGLDHQKELKNINSAVQQIRKTQNQLVVKVLTLEESGNKSPERWISKLNTHNSTSQPGQFLDPDSSKHLTDSKLLNEPGQGSSSSFESGKYNKNLFKSPEKDSLSVKLELNKMGGSLDYIPDDVPAPLSYRLDKQNYLLDDEGNYILDSQGKQIKLSQQQINTIKSSNIIKYQE